ncbi:MAG TPA: hypothetical protein VK844_02755, partial [Hyphomicrobiales bacterium]|nr:hypothetical protein [Hyphomicrobiales bacterium]
MGLFDPALDQMMLAALETPNDMSSLDSLDTFERAIDTLVELSTMLGCDADEIELLRGGILMLRGRIGEAERLYSSRLPPLDDAVTVYGLIGHLGHASILGMQRRDEEALAIMTA